MVEAEGAGQRAKVVARPAYNEDAYLKSEEMVEVHQGVVFRSKYSYHFIERGVRRWGYDLDPSHDPAVHMHPGPGHERETASLVTFKEALAKGWETISEAAGESGDT